MYMHLAFKGCVDKTLVLVHKFIATTYKHNSWHKHMNFYLLEDDVYFVSPMDVHV